MRLAALVVLALAVLPSAASAQRSERIVGGRPASQPYPFAAQVRVFDSAAARQSGMGTYELCGGTLVAPRFVLTAGHCVRDLQPDGSFVAAPTDGISVYLGKTRNSQMTEADRFDVLRVDVHPGFSETQTKEIYNDAAVLTLSRPATGLEPVRLVRSDEPQLSAPGVQATAIGWGAQGSGPNAQLPDELQEVQLPTVSDDTCEGQYYDPRVYEPALHLCAGGNPGQDTCPGDSGGPLLSPADGGWVLIGITSFGPVCGNGRPAVYTDVTTASINTWIRGAASDAEFTTDDVLAPEVPITFRQTASFPSGSRPTFTWDLDGDGEYDDASGPSATHVFPAPTQATVGLRVTDDTGNRQEARRVYDVRYRSLVSVATPSVRVAEGEAALVTFAKPGRGTGSIGVAAAPLTASLGADFAAPGVPALFFVENEPAKQLPVQTVEDRVDEPDETFRVDLGPATGGLAAAVPTQAVVTIVDDDAPPTPLKLVSVKQAGRRSAVTVRVRVPGPGGYVVGLTDRRLKKKWGERVSVARAGGERTLTVKLTSAARRLLTRDKALRVAVTLYYEPEDEEAFGKPRLVDRGLTLRLKRRAGAR